MIRACMVIVGIILIILFIRKQMTTKMTLTTIQDSCEGNLDATPLALFLFLIKTLMKTKCSLGSHDNYPKSYGPKLQNDDHFDFIVIGSGAGGSVVANKLSENKNWRVLVLEAGGVPSATSDIPLLLFSVLDTNDNWKYTSEVAEQSCLGFKDKRCRWSTGKALGGSSSLDDMIYIKGNKRDYDKWAELGNSGWDWKNVKEYFTALENLQSLVDHRTTLGRNGLLPITKIKNNDPIKHSITRGLHQLGIHNNEAYNPENPIGSIDAPLCIHNGMRSNIGKKLLGAVKDRKNLFITTNAFVEKIVIDPITNTATGVMVNIAKKTLHLKADKEVILSAGSINSPQLLMLSGIGPKDHLEALDIPLIKDLPVGKNLQSHLVFTGLDVKVDLNATLPVDPVDVLYEYYRHRTGVLSTTGIMNYVNFVNTKNDSIWPNIAYQHVLFPPSDDIVFPAFVKAMGFTDEIILEKERSSKYDPVLSIFSNLLNPKSRGKVLLRSKNVTDKPLVHSGFFTDKKNEDINIMLDSIRFIEKLFDTKEITKHNPELIRLPLTECDKFEFKSDKYWKCALRHLSTSIYHPTSTCTMGPNDDGISVVDSRLKIHGINHLRVVDSSIMPFITSSNTYAPSLMIGYKSGVMITEDWTETDNLITQESNQNINITGNENTNLKDKNENVIVSDNKTENVINENRYENMTPNNNKKGSNMNNHMYTEEDTEQERNKIVTTKNTDEKHIDDGNEHESVITEERNKHELLHERRKEL